MKQILQNSKLSTSLHIKAVNIAKDKNCHTSNRIEHEIENITYENYIYAVFTKNKSLKLENIFRFFKEISLSKSQKQLLSLFYELFKSIFLNNNNIKNNLLLLTRFYPLDKLDAIVHAISQEKNSKIMSDYKEVKEDFKSWGSHLARHPIESLHSLSNGYKNIKIESSLKQTIEDEKKYADSRKELVKKILVDIETLGKKCAPSSQEFSKLPKSSSETQTCAMILERVAFWNHDRHKEKLNPDAILFKTLHTHFSITPFYGRYAYAEILADTILKYSQAPDMERSSCNSFYTLCYTINGKKFKVTDVLVAVYHSGTDKISYYAWEHGKNDFRKAAWPLIESLYNQIVNIELRSFDKKLPKENLIVFYAKLAELIWLIG